MVYGAGTNRAAALLGRMVRSGATVRSHELHVGRHALPGNEFDAEKTGHGEEG